MDFEKRPNGSKEFNELYSEDRIERLKNILIDSKEDGIERQFTILVDGEVVVPRTNEINYFDKFRKYYVAGSKRLEIRLFFGDSPNFNRYVFHASTQELMGAKEPFVNDRVQEAVEKERMLTTIVNLQKKVKRKSKRIKLLKEELSTYSDKKNPLNGLIEMVATNFIASKTGASDLSGTTEEETEVSVEVEDQVPSKADTVYQDLKDSYPDDQVEHVLAIAIIYLQDKTFKEKVDQIIHQKGNQNG